jgi:transposase
MKRFREAVLPRAQGVLIPTTLEEAIPQDAPVRVFHELVQALDHRALVGSYLGGGAPAYHPVMLLEVLLFAYNEGVRSSRQIAKLLTYDVRFMYLAERQQPDFRTLCLFRRQHTDALVTLFTAVVRLAMELGLVALEHVAVDGTKIEAVASREAAFNDERLTRKLAQATARLQTILAEAETVDAVEEEQPEATLPDALATAQQRLKRLQEIQAAKGDKSGPYVATEPECGVMKTRGGKRPAYNVQAAVDAEAQVVLAVEVMTTAADNHAAPAVLDQVEAVTDARPAQVSMDGGYWSPETLTAAEERGLDLYLPPQGGDHAADGFTYDAETDTYTCPQGERLGFLKTRTDKGRRYRIYRCVCATCPQAATCHGTSKRYKDLWRRQWTPAEAAHQRKMATDAARAVYRRRAATVEPVFGQWKLISGFTRALLHGTSGVRIEVLLVAISHNLRKCAQAWAPCVQPVSAVA